MKEALKNKKINFDIMIYNGNFDFHFPYYDGNSFYHNRNFYTLNIDRSVNFIYEIEYKATFNLFYKIKYDIISNNILSDESQLIKL